MRWGTLPEQVVSHGSKLPDGVWPCGSCRANADDAMFARLVVIRGAGDLATGIAYRLYRAGFPVVMTETTQPTVVRRTVAFAQAVFDGVTRVEGVPARLARCPEEALALATDSHVSVVVDPEATVVHALQPGAVVDAIMAKRNTGTHLDDAPLVIGVGPGFRAGVDVHAVVESNRGHWLGRVLLEGEAEPNTGVPAPVGGHGAERVLRAPADGPLVSLKQIGDLVRGGEPICSVAVETVLAPFTGYLRGLIQDGVVVTTGMKIGDVDPRATRQHCFTISDKALAIGGGVLEAMLMLSGGRRMS